MSRIAIVGGHGKIALLLARELTSAGHEVVSIARNPEHTGDIEETGATAAIVDIETANVDDLRPAIEGADAVVFAAGAGAGSGVERKRTVDYGGSVTSAAAAAAVGARRFVQVSAIGVENDPDPERGEVWGAYVIAKREADDALRATQLDWTIIRPGRLTDGPGTGRVTLSSTVTYGEVPRADVASTIAAVLDAPETIGRTFDLVSGDTEIADAVRTASA
ncbi:SDR family oxidoreductase [Paramicrobacterium sp. CJ85]|uniref:SDR family oxidoreductase n=1 Tax=Paramicrobacterium sp. CJ85 TaxID=3445355 RepID=UPI003F5D8DB5